MKILIASVCLLVLVSCSSAPGSPATTPPTAPSPGGEKVLKTPQPVTIEVTASKHRFQPNNIKVKSGQQVTLKLISSDVMHGITIPALRKASSIQPGKENTLQFIAPKPGIYEFYSNVPSGPGYENMRGKITVTE